MIAAPLPSGQAPAAAPSMAQPVFMAQMNVEQFSADFLAWLPSNLHVYRAFEAEAFAVIRAGIKHYSARTIIHVLRHHSALAENGKGWKLNDHTSPYLGRLFSLLHPEHAGMWETRTCKAARKGRVTS